MPAPFGSPQPGRRSRRHRLPPRGAVASGGGRARGERLPLIQVFTRAPLLGQVKSRLARREGAEAAMLWHARMLWHCLGNASRAPHAELQLWVAGDAGHPFLQACARHFGARIHAQCGGDLGRRMLYAAGCGLRRRRPVLLMGSDCPALTPARLRAAWRGLRRGAPVVLGPARDGGYVLLALARLHPALFRAIPWGSCRVAAMTRRRLRHLGWRWDELQALPDVDRPADLRRPLLRSLALPSELLPLLGVAPQRAANSEAA